MSWPEWIQVMDQGGTFVLLVFLVPKLSDSPCSPILDEGLAGQNRRCIGPAVSCFITSFVYWNVAADRIKEAGDYPCGMFGAAAAVGDSDSCRTERRRWPRHYAGVIRAA